LTNAEKTYIHYAEDIMIDPELLYMSYFRSPYADPKRKKSKPKDKRCYVCGEPHNDNTKFCSDACYDKYLKKEK